ncbi:MAG: hypothetical protein AABY22_26880, partial [Nanoarchaeota archaeon]
MSWTDLESLRTINRLKEEFKIRHFIETGAYKGTNALVQSKNFQFITTCEINKELYEIAKERLKKYKNIFIYNLDSVDYLLKIYRIINPDEIVFIYLDAHFYDPKLKNKFHVLKELNAIA